MSPIETRPGEARTPGGRWYPVRVVDGEYCYHETESNILYTIPCFDSSGIDFAAECIKEPAKSKRNAPILLTGDPGLGKSTVINSIAPRIDPNIDAKFNTFTIEEFDEIYNSNPAGNAKLGKFPQTNMDEAAHAMYGPEYLEMEQRMINKNLIVSRIMQQIVYFATPKWKLLNPHTRNLVSFWIHVFEPTYYLQGVAIFKTAPPYRQSEYQAAKYWEPYFAFIFPPLKNRLWGEYEEKKIAFVKNCGQAKAEDKSGSWIRQVVTNLSRRGMTQDDIAEIIGRDRSRVSRYLHHT